MVPKVFPHWNWPGKEGEYIAIARRKGDNWFIGAMTNWEARDLTICFSFLPPGSYEALIFKDGPNAHRNGSDFVSSKIAITSGQQINIKMSSGGGWAAIITPER